MYISLGLLSSTVIVSAILLIRKIFSEHRREIFDLSTPTLFESGLLVFRSPMKRVAIFFAYNISNTNFEESTVHRTLTILLKILPISTILALEWTSRRECFITFYIKLEKASFLKSSREIMDNITKSFRNTLGFQSFRLLNGNELMNHFSMGVSGRIQKISVSRKGQIEIKTERGNSKKSFATITPANFEEFNEILNKFEMNENLRMILPVKKIENATMVSKSMILVLDNSTIYNALQEQTQDSLSIKPISASKSIHLLGDILSRNLVQKPTLEIKFPETATMLVNLLSTQRSSQRQQDPTTKTDQADETEIIDSRTWRELLINQLLHFELSFEKDRILFIERIPIRVDVQVEDLLIFVIPTAKQHHLEWLIQKITTFLEKNQTENIIFLLTQQSNLVLAQTNLSRFTKHRRIHFVRTKEELAAFLKEKKTQLDKKQEIIQVA